MEKLTPLYKIALSCLICLLVTTSCKDSFLEIQPDDALLDSEFIQTEEDLQEVLNAAYKYLADGNFMGGGYWLLADLTADQIEGDVDGEWGAHYGRNTDIFLDTTRDLMKAAGRSNAYANLVLSRLGDFDLSEEERKRLEGECHFIRAVVHFELVKAFAHPYGYTSDNSHAGISIWTEVTTEPQPRASVAAVYIQILEDLKIAWNNIPESNGDYATKQAAEGYLAKVYFQMNDFENAYNYADLVIESGKGYTLTDLDKRFSNFESTESVFELVSGNNADIGTNNIGGKLNGLYNTLASGQSPSVTVSGAYYVQYLGELGNRSIWFEAEVTYTGFKKYPSGTDFNVPLVHLTELKLIRAESAAETNNNLEQAVDDLNDILNRAGIQALPSSSSAVEIIGIARRERNIEMVLEGNRLHELKRIAVRDKPNQLIRGAIWSCPGMIFQFPDTELNGNPDFESNPQGGC